MSKQKSAVNQYVLLPPRGLRAEGVLHSAFTKELNADVRPRAMRAFGVARASGVTAGLRRPSVRVVSQINEDKAKLLEMTPEDALAMRTQLPGARLIPVRYYRTAVAPKPALLQVAKKAAAGPSLRITLTFVSKEDGSPISGATVVAFTDFDQRIGAGGTTNAQGKVSLSLGGSRVKLQRLYVYPAKDSWGLLKKNVTVTSGNQFKLRPISFPYVDVLAQFYGAGSITDGSGVKVGVVDTGSGPHPDLVVAGGENTVPGESPADFHDNGDMHGTHVAGIIAARGNAPTGRSGVAPAATIMSYRVFGKGADGASNFAIAKAIDRAISADCDVINMSLGGGDADEAIESAIADARAAGAVVIVAAGNDDHSPVSFPASDVRAVAVSAMGRKGTFPRESTESGDVAKPFAASDNKNFIAAFSNIGPEIDLTGTGVGVVSTVLGGYANMSGTSMACPAVTGFAARLLAAKPQIVNMPRNQDRSDAIIQLLYGSAKVLGFGTHFEGHGLPE
jgi:subtilisin